MQQKQEFVVLNALDQHLQTLLENRGDWNISLYDLGWVLRTDFFNHKEQYGYIKWLLYNQNDDGTWGSAEYMPHSAVVDTLSIMMLFVDLDIEIPKFKRLEQRLIELLIECHAYPYHDTVAFELIIPSALKWLDIRGVALNMPQQMAEFMTAVQHKMDQKLKIMIESGMIFNPNSTLSFTFEAILTAAEIEDETLVPDMMLPNGAIGLSPSATAAGIIVHRKMGQPAPQGLYDYLAMSFADYEAVGFPNLHPIDTSRQLWNLLPWFVSGNITEAAQLSSIGETVETIYDAIEPDENGCVSWDTANKGLADLDDTAVSFALFHFLDGIDLDVLPKVMDESFRYFQPDADHFVCYPNEAHPSPAAFMHTLMAIDLAEQNGNNSAYLHEAKQVLLTLLDPSDKSIFELCQDKWHCTWTYGAQRWLSLPILRDTYPDYVLALVEEILELEDDGMWGLLEPTIEETAYVVSGLVKLMKDGFPLPEEIYQEITHALVRAAKVFDEVSFDISEVEMPPIWISKNLYAPKYQIMSAILDAKYSLVTYFAPD